MEYRAVLSKSDNDKKKYKVIVSDGNKKKTLHFGQAGANDYTITGDDQAKKRYLLRHKGMGEDWTDPMTRGFWSRQLLWREKSIPASKKAIRDDFNVKFVKKI